MHNWASPETKILFLLHLVFVPYNWYIQENPTWDEQELSNIFQIYIPAGKRNLIGSKLFWQNQDSDMELLVWRKLILIVSNQWFFPDN